MVVVGVRMWWGGGASRSSSSNSIAGCHPQLRALDPALEAALSVSACRPRTQLLKGYGTFNRRRQDKLSEIAA